MHKIAHLSARPQVLAGFKDPKDMRKLLVWALNVKLTNTLPGQGRERTLEDLFLVWSERYQQ